MKSLKSTVGVLLAACGVALVSVLPASAGIKLAGNMQAAPNPATVGDTVTVSNQPGETNTCHDDLGPTLVPVTRAGVVVRITAPDGSEDFRELSPDVNGDWSFELTAGQEGTYYVEAACLNVESGPKGAAAEPSFEYFPLDVVVAQVPDTLEPTTTSMETADTSGETTTTAAAAVAAAPRYTG